MKAIIGYSERFGHFVRVGNKYVNPSNGKLTDNPGFYFSSADSALRTCDIWNREHKEEIPCEVVSWKF